MASTDARPIPKKNVAYRVYLPILDADGDLVTGATGLDSEVSIDGAAFGDCTNEATEIGSSGMYSLDLTSSEMNGDAIIIVVKTSSVGAKTTPVILYPEEAGDIRVDVTMVSGDATAADNLEAAADGTGYNLGGGSVVAASVTGAVGSVASGGITAASLASDTITAAKIANDAITAAKIATGAIDADALADGAIDAGAIAADAITAAKIAADAVTELQSGLATASALVTAQADLDNIQTRLPAALVSGRMDSSVGEMAANVLTAAATNADTGTEIAGAVRTELATELGRIDAAITTRLASGSYTAPPSAATISSTVWGESVRALTDKAGFALSSAGIQAIWDALTSALTTAGSVGKLLVDNVNATVSSRLASGSYTAPDNATITAINAKTANLPASPAAVGSAMTLTLAQSIPDGQTEGSVGYALAAAEADGAGDWTLVGTTLTLKRKSGTPFAVFEIDDPDAPTERVAS